MTPHYPLFCVVSNGEKPLIVFFLLMGVSIMSVILMDITLDRISDWLKKRKEPK